LGVAEQLPRSDVDRASLPPSQAGRHNPSPSVRAPETNRRTRRNDAIHASRPNDRPASSQRAHESPSPRASKRRAAGPRRSMR
jgi:hypothetical protein